jgi:hypothetical protein
MTIERSEDVLVSGPDDANGTPTLIRRGDQASIWQERVTVLDALPFPTDPGVARSRAREYHRAGLALAGVADDETLAAMEQTQQRLLAV